MSVDEVREQANKANNLVDEASDKVNNNPLMNAAEEEEQRVRPNRPRHYDLDEPKLWEMIERRNCDILKDTFGSTEGIAKTLQTDLKKGIDASTVEKRQEQFGKNELSKRKPVTFLEMVIDALKDRVIQILLVAAILSIIFGLALPNPHTGKREYETGWIEGFAILISVFVVVMVGAINNYQKAKKFEEMEQEQSIKALSVVRNGQSMTLNSNEIVVGDVVVVENGSELTCDMIVISQSDLKTNESAITGEPDLIKKSAADGDDDPFLVSGTAVEEGNAMGLVIAVGMDSFQGQLKSALDEESAETPLQEHLTELGDNIGKFGLLLAFLLLLALIIKEVVLITAYGHEAHPVRFLNFLIIAVTIIAVAIPEGLPLAVTIALAFSMKAMMEDQCMVRVLASCETMGAATAICSDKTGTLTMNQMTVVQSALYEKEFIMDKYGLQPRNRDVVVLDRDNLQVPLKPDLQNEYAFALCINSTAHKVQKEGQLVWTGNKTEIGILGLVERMGINCEEKRKSVRAADVRQFAFSSAKKRMTTLVRVESTGKVVAYAKGASEAILESCSYWKNSSGQLKELDTAKETELGEIIMDMANQGNRTIGVAMCVETGLDGCSSFPEEEPMNLKYVWLGVLGIQDPMRPEVPDAVSNCNTARLIIRMVTGDNINTAIAISKKANIIKEGTNDMAMTGPDFRKMYKEDKEKLMPMLPKLRVLARSSPNDKYILVGLLQENGEVVGVTGDGTNDAPALKLADVGFAMNTGTDIAKGASDMVLLDDNFATTVTAIKWGRAVNDNIKKFLQYQLAINFAGVGITIVGSLASLHSKEPIAPVQLLWLNLIMDTLAALSLATERPEDASLLRLPVYKQAPLITRRMWSFIGIHGIFQFTLTILIFFLGHNWFETFDKFKDGCGRDMRDNTNTTVATNPTLKYCQEECEFVGGQYEGSGICKQGAVHSTIIFNTFIWFQIFNVFNARKIYGELNCFEGLFARSKPLLIVFFIIIVLQIMCVELFGRFMKTHGLSGRDWGICIGLGAFELILGFFVRLLPITDFVPDEAMRREQAERERQEAAQNAQAAVSKEIKDPAVRNRGSSMVRKNKDDVFKSSAVFDQ